MSRREFIKRSVQSAVLLYSAVELPAVCADAQRAQLKSLPAFLDTLIPADSTPSASQLGLDQALIQHATRIENYTRLLELGCEWLDKTSVDLHGANFDGLAQAQRESVVTLAEAGPDSTIPNMFFERVWFDLLGLYYASPASWDGLISSPPQPVGYPDYTRPPNRRSRG